MVLLVCTSAQPEFDANPYLPEPVATLYVPERPDICRIAQNPASELEGADGVCVCAPLDAAVPLSAGMLWV